jgi:hypothetical protein
MLKPKRIREAVEECRYFLRRVKMYREEFELRGRATQESLVNASYALTGALKKMRADVDNSQKPKKAYQPTILELARSEARKVFVTKKDRDELKNGGVHVRLDRLTGKKQYMDVAEAALFLEKYYPSLGIKADSDACDVIRKLYCDRSRPRKSDELPF